MTEVAPREAWFELECAEEGGYEEVGAWACHDMGTVDGDVDGTRYVRGDVADEHKRQRDLLLAFVRRVNDHHSGHIPLTLRGGSYNAIAECEK